jgi:hypothetical protein
VIQFTSRVVPPSSEYACSKCGEGVSSFVHRNPTRTVRPFQVSSAKNSPICGGSNLPAVRLAQ